MPPKPPTHAQILLARVAAWNRSHGPGQQIDPQAELRVAGQEGLSGGIGDGGHAFGPNQLNDAGGVLTGKIGGTPAQKNAWAWTPEGIDYALAGVAGAAGGEHGGRAVEDIVRRFERPADPNGEVARALGGSPVGGGAAGSLSAGLATAAAPDAHRQFAQQLIGAIGPTGQLNDPGALVGALQNRRATLATAAAPAAPPAGGGKPGLTSVDGVEVDGRIAAQLQRIVQQFGVHPTSGYRDPAHNASVGGAGNSDHLRGDAVDFGGNPAALAALYKYAQGRFPYVEPMAQAQNHVHISFMRPGG